MKKKKKRKEKSEIKSLIKAVWWWSSLFSSKRNFTREIVYKIKSNDDVERREKEIENIFLAFLFVILPAS